MKHPENKYRKGYTVFSISELAIGLKTGHWYYWDDKVMHPGFLLGMPLRTIINAIVRRAIAEAIDQQREKRLKEINNA